MKKKILVLRFSSIGDIVLTTPVLRSLSHQLPDTEIHYATKKQYSSILAANPYVTKIHLLDNSLSDLIKRLKAEKFDQIIDLHNNLRTLKIKFQLGIKSNTFNKLNFKKWLFVNVKINLLPDVHIVDRYMKTVSSLGVVNDGMGLDYFIPAAEKVDLATLPAGFQEGYIAVVIGAMHFTKKLPDEKLIELCSMIRRKIILVGGKEDEEKGHIIAATDSNKIFNACGKYSLNQSASIIHQAEIVISHDTGMMHIAAAFKKDLYTVWGNTVPEFGMYPYAGGKNIAALRKENRILEIKGLSCRPCSKIGYEKCPLGHFKCMRLIEFQHLPS